MQVSQVGKIIVQFKLQYQVIRVLMYIISNKILVLTKTKQFSKSILRLIKIGDKTNLQTLRINKM